MRSLSRARLTRWARRRDPNWILLSRGIRTAVALPLAYLVLVYALDMPAGATQACYAAFSQLAMADFAGTARQRAIAYVGVGLAGLPLIAIGWLTLGSTPAAVAVTCVLALGANFACLLRGNAGRAAAALMMPLILAVSSGAAGGDLTEQLVGYVIGSCLSLAAALLVWPADSDARVRAAIAASLTEAAERIAAWPPGSRAGDASEAVRRAECSVDRYLERPGLTNARDRALLLTLDELHFLDQLLDADDPPAGSDWIDGQLAAASAATLRAAAEMLIGTDTAAQAQLPDLIDDLDKARVEHLRQVTALITAPSPPPTEQVLARFRVREVALSSEVITAYVGAAVTGDRAASVPAPSLAGAPLWGALVRVSGREQLRRELLSGGPWLRNAVRGALAIAAATLVVLVADVPRGYWVVLGTLTALRFDALGTRRNAVQMIVGTCAGFIAGCGVVVFGSDSQVVLWTVFVVTSFLASYTPRLIGLWIGQASFTVLSVAIFAISTPDNFGAAESRVLDIAIAIAVSLAVSALVWPRGVRQVAQRSLLAAAAGSAAEFVFEMGRAVGRPGDPAGSPGAAAALETAEEAYELARSQGVPGLPAPLAWAHVSNMLAAVNHESRMIHAVTRHLGPLHLSPDAAGDIRARAACVTDRLPTLTAAIFERDGHVPARTPERASAELGSAPALLMQTRTAESDDAHLTQPIWLAERLILLDQLVNRSRDQASADT